MFRYAVRPGSSQNADVYLSNHKGGHNGWVQKWDPKFVRQIQDTFDRLKRYPFHILTHDIHCFTTLYGMLGRRNKDTARAAWQLLTKDGVPTNVREVLIVVHVGGTCTRCVTSNTDHIMKLQARITLGGEVIGACGLSYYFSCRFEDNDEYDQY